MNEMRKVTIQVGFSRKVTINYTSFDFSTGYTEEVAAITDEDVTKARQRLRLRAVGAVYNDVFNDMNRILPHQNNSLCEAQVKALIDESVTALQDVSAQLEALSKS